MKRNSGPGQTDQLVIGGELGERFAYCEQGLTKSELACIGASLAPRSPALSIAPDLMARVFSGAETAVQVSHGVPAERSTRASATPITAHRSASVRSKIAYSPKIAVMSTAQLDCSSAEQLGEEDGPRCI